MSKSIKQIAEEIGVSRQAIYQKIKRDTELSNSLQPFAETVDNVLYYTEEGENIIKQAFVNYVDSTRALNNENKKTTSNNSKSDSLKVIATDLQVMLNILRSQLEVKDRQLEELQSQLAEKDNQITEKDNQIRILYDELAKERSHSREQSDQLAVLADQAQKLHLTAIATDLPEIEEVVSKQEQIPEKKGFFKKIFKSK